MEPAAVVCEYCGLQNPIETGRTIEALSAEQRADVTRRRRTAAAVVGGVSVFALVLGAALFVWARDQADTRARAAVAPLCNDTKVQDAVRELVMENALRDTDPAVAAKYQAGAFRLTGLSERTTTAPAQGRRCAATLEYEPTGPVLAFVTEYLEGGRTILDARLSEAEIVTATSALRAAWHRSAQRFEIALPYGVERDQQDVARSWTIVVDEQALVGASALIHVLVVAAEPGGSGPGPTSKGP